MAGQHSFEHLPLLRRYQGRARLSGGGTTAPQTLANTANPNARQAHSESLRAAGQLLAENWQARKAHRQGQNLPIIPEGIPILLQVDTSLELDVLRDKFKFEIVAEQEEGYVIVASEDIQLGTFLQMVQGFSVQVHGSATVAKVHKLFDDLNQMDRLRRILSERLFTAWPTVDDNQVYIVDVGIGCAGTQEIPPYPNRGKRDTDADWANKESTWSQARSQAYSAWEQIRISRENEILVFSKFYRAEIMNIIDGQSYNAAVLSDSFTIRMEIKGKGLKDFILNYAYIFEVVEPENILLPRGDGKAGDRPAQMAEPTPPDANAPAVCVIDSGIQEGHVLLQPAIDQPTSHCFLPGRKGNEINDLVSPAGHGTRVAGAVLYGETVAKVGAPKLPFWIQNARVLDEYNRMPVELFPPVAVRAAVEHFHKGSRHTRIFNHSINADGYSRIRYMSAWAAEIDSLCDAYDVLVVQSSGNLQITGTSPFLGIGDHLAAGRIYPAYLSEPSSRIANPGQSLQVLTVGSVAYGSLASNGWQTFATQPGHPSPFSRSGPAIWNIIKPEVVEYGGDAIYSGATNPNIQIGGWIAAACPELVRSTMFAPGPAYDRDQAGTSFAAPKVTRITAQLQRLFPGEPALLYRALVVQSARWPTWAESILTELRSPDIRQNYVLRQQRLEEATRILHYIGYGLPDETRATANDDHRTTFITSGESAIRARECHIYQVPIPQELRRQADEYDIRIDVTLSYVAKPRRTRRHLRRYLSTWVDWKTSRLGESLNNFQVRAMREEGEADAAAGGSTLPWTIHEKPGDGLIRDTKRNSGTVQKDWAVVKSNALPDHFCIAVVGHQGWSRDPDSTARYAMAVTFEILGKEIAIYDPLRVAVQELQTEVEVDVDVQTEAEVDID